MEPFKTLAISIFLALTLSFCGGDESNSGNSNRSGNKSPVISNMIFTPSSTNQFSGGGSITVSGAIDFIDSDGDIETVIIIDGLGDSLSIPVSGVDGVTAGTILIDVFVNTTVTGDFVFRLYAVDSLGNESNTLIGVFSVT
ncbi:MAG: hypothetical protein KDK51_02380 [Deltaproteobacteria bacterium]|nr:hypothetical protein [Deltaproteobacteria bacterium]